MRLPKYTDQSYPRALSPRLSPDHVAVMLGVVVAALAGLCGSLASVFAKLTVEHGDEMHGSVRDTLIGTFFYSFLTLLCR